MKRSRLPHLVIPAKAGIHIWTPASAGVTNKGCRGVTLVETMMAVSILGTVIALGAALVIQFEKAWLASSARYETQRDTRQCLDIIDRFLREGVNSTIVIDSPSGQGVYSRISFTTLSGNNMKFYQQGNQLIMANGTKQNIMSHNLLYLAFTFSNSNAPNLVSVAMAMSKKIYNGQQKTLEINIRSVRVMN